ncbi:MAG: potassium transporter TrkG [Ignisphaera sp.]
MYRIKAIIFSTCVLLSTLMIIALAIGVTFYVYSSYVDNSIELNASRNFLAIVTVILVVSSIIAYIFRHYVITEIVDALIVVAIYWFIVPFVNALIYGYVIGLDFVNALFESVSGFSGTGLTILSDIEKYPYIVLMWRAATQWIGELSVVVFSGALLPHIHRILSRVYVAERGVRFAPTILSTTRRMLITYIILTIIGVFMFMYSGMEFLDALAHSMTGIATGGMSTNTQSIAYWYKTHGYRILVVSTIVMILGALNFVDLYNLVRGKIKEFFKSLEVKWFILITVILAIITIGITLCLLGNSFEHVVIVIYNLMSGLTTTGFQVGDIGRYPDILKILIILAMAIGGATFSTAGGIKIKRVALVFKSVVWSLSKSFLPENVYIVKKVNGEIVEDEDIVSTYAFILLYIVIALTASASLFIILQVRGYNWSYSYIDVLFETVSALSCVGLSTGVTTIFMPLEAKVVLMIVMYLGRLEFLPIYLIIGYLYRKKITLG